MFFRKNFYTVIILSSFLGGCALFPNNDDSHHRTCSELKHRIIFSNGAGAMDQNDAFRNRMDLGKLNQAYHDEGCV